VLSVLHEILFNFEVGCGTLPLTEKKSYRRMAIVFSAFSFCQVVGLCDRPLFCRTGGIIGSDPRQDIFAETLKIGTFEKIGLEKIFVVYEINC